MNVKKGIIIISAVLAVLVVYMSTLVLFSSCTQSSPYVDGDISKFEVTEYFIEAGGIGKYSFVYDKYTKVMYAKYSSPGGFSSMTVLFNADGTVMTLDDWERTKKRTAIITK